MKKYLWIIICLVALLAAGSALGVEAVLPPGYGEGTDARAVIYLMPDEPGKAVNSGLTELLRAEMEQNDVLPMILVPVEVAAGQDPMAALRETVAATDAEFIRIHLAIGFTDSASRACWRHRRLFRRQSHEILFARTWYKLKLRETRALFHVGLFPKQQTLFRNSHFQTTKVRLWRSPWAASR